MFMSQYFHILQLLQAIRMNSGQIYSPWQSVCGRYVENAITAWQSGLKLINVFLLYVHNINVFLLYVMFSPICFMLVPFCIQTFFLRTVKICINQLIS